MMAIADQAYTAQTPYISAYFRQQHAPLMRWTSLLAGYAPPSQATQTLPHCELGFGQGLGLSIAAVTGLDRQVGVDFMANQVASVQDRLSQVGMTDVLLLAQDFAQFLDTNQLRFQTISLHGVWSWVSNETRAQLLAIFDRFLADDGQLYISYNVLPGCAASLPIQRLIYHTSVQFRDQSDQGLVAAFSVMNSALPLSHYVQQTPQVIDWWQGLATEHPRYLQHEYLNNGWQPMLFADIATAMSKANLVWQCAADAIELLPDLHLHLHQQDWLAAIDVEPLRQSYADMMRNQNFRQDIWSKQPHRLTQAQQWQQMQSQRLVLIQPIGCVPLVLTGDLGQFTLSETVLVPLLHFLAADNFRAKSVAESVVVLAEQDIHLSSSDWISVWTQLTALGYVHPAQADAVVAQVLSRTQAFNRALCASAWQANDDQASYLASPLAGCGVQVSIWQQRLLYAREQTGSERWQDWLAFCQHNLTEVLPEQLIMVAEQFVAQGRYAMLRAHGVIA